MDRRNLRRPGALVLATIAAGSVVALGLGIASGLTPTHAAAPPPTPPSARATSAPSHSAHPTATAVPLPKTGTLRRPGAPTPPIDLAVPFVGGAWPVGLFVAEVREVPSKIPGSTTVMAGLGILNEANQPLTIGMAVQYKEAISLYAEDRWKGLVFVAFQTAGGKDVLPAQGAGAADLPPGVWAKAQIAADIPAGDSLTALEAGLTRDRMAAYPLSAATLNVTGQPWAAPGAAATPVSITAAPAPTQR